MAAAVFEALSELDEAAVERGAMEAYLHSAESVTDSDELYLVLLSTMATEIDARLDSDRQAEVVRAAAERLGERSALGDPMDATLARFDGLSLVGDYAVVPTDGTAEHGLAERETVGGEGSSTGRSWTVTVEEYAFESPDGRVPTLPLAVELYRRLRDETVAVSDLRAKSPAEWECVVSTDAGRVRAISVAAPENA